jgi:hypothetical protein
MCGVCPLRLIAAGQGKLPPQQRRENKDLGCGNGGLPRGTRLADEVPKTASRLQADCKRQAWEAFK